MTKQRTRLVKPKTKTKLVKIGWLNRYYDTTGTQSNILLVQKRKPRSKPLQQFAIGYIDTVRVFAEVPVTPRKASAVKRKGRER